MFPISLVMFVVILVTTVLSADGEVGEARRSLSARLERLEAEFST